nr:MAG TPA: hypothetical protein [Caudoviricetes sp.]
MFIFLLSIFYRYSYYQSLIIYSIILFIFLFSLSYRYYYYVYLYICYRYL